MRRHQLQKQRAWDSRSGSHRQRTRPEDWSRLCTVAAPAGKAFQVPVCAFSLVGVSNCQIRILTKRQRFDDSVVNEIQLGG